MRVVVVLPASVFPFHAPPLLKRRLSLDLRLIGCLECLGGRSLGRLVRALASLSSVSRRLAGRHLRQRIDLRLVEERLVEPGHHQQISAGRLAATLRLLFRSGRRLPASLASDGRARAETQNIFHAILHPHDGFAIGGEDVARFQGEETALLHRGHCLGIVGERLFRFQFGTEAGRLPGNVHYFQFPQSIA